MQDKQNTPTLDDVYKELEKLGKTELSEKVKQTVTMSSLFEIAAFKYLKAIPSNLTFYDAKYNIRENMEEIEQYPLLKDVLISMNPVEAISIGLDLIGCKVVLRHQITVSDVLSQLSEGDTDS